MCCGVVPILFGWFLRVPSLHALVFIQKTFFVTYYYIQEFTYNAAALVESVSPMFVSLLIMQLPWLKVFHRCS